MSATTRHHGSKYPAESNGNLTGPGPRTRVSRVMRTLAALSCALVLALGCSRAPRPGRVIVLAFDGMDPRTVDLMLSEGKLPHFARLRQEGAYGRLQSSPPLLSPVVWTTIATGKTPDQHGIGHFVAVSPAGEQLPVTSRMRKVKAAWNILSEAGRSVAVVGWWATWPAEPLKGAVVSDHTCYHFLFPQQAGGESQGVTHPPELFARISPLVRRPGDVTPEEAARFIDVSPEELRRPFDFQDDVSHFKWALATADSYRRIGLELWRKDRPQVLFTYIEATDSVAHLFGHLFRAGPLSGELAEQQRKFGQAVERMYVRADEILGEYLQAMDADTTLLVLSDHGFELGALPDDPSTTRDMRRVSERFHREQGILYLYGRGVKRGRIDGARILDVAPTVLALAGLPKAADMPGRVVADALALDVPSPQVASYETGAAAGAPAADGQVDPAILERLKSLGYVGGNAPPPPAPSPAGDARLRSPEGERNLAAMLFQSGRHREAADAYAKLVKESPDNSALRTSLAGALGALGRYQDALEQLEIASRLDPLNVEAYHNRGAALERLGRKDEAIRQYRTAVRYRPQYEPSRQALVRLTGSADVNAPRTDAERRAFRLAEDAAAAARRGDYGGADRLLAEAERAAPRYVLVHQYRSNVAYLAGDRPGAVRALEKALALEPDNALFRSNLARLRDASPKPKPRP
jgi:predicted AlkP superfamily phosphohydrolase/phosphomutase/Flp pilus assembly protein TadD